MRHSGPITEARQPASLPKKRSLLTCLPRSIQSCHWAAKLKGITDLIQASWTHQADSLTIDSLDADQAMPWFLLETLRGCAIETIPGVMLLQGPGQGALQAVPAVLGAAADGAALQGGQGAGARPLQAHE